MGQKAKKQSLPMRCGDVSPPMLRRGVRFTTEVALVGPFVRGVIIGDDLLPDDITRADVYPRMERQVTFRAECFIAERAHVHLVLFALAVIVHFGLL